MEKPKMINGGVAVDDRGSVRFVNDFNFSDVKRFYHVENHRQGFVRAWHGHLKEGKYVYVVRGSIQLKLHEMKELTRDQKLMSVYKSRAHDYTLDKSTWKTYVLSSQAPKVLYIPPGYANGFKTLEQDTSVMFFSTVTMDEAKDDDYRFPTTEKEWKEDYR